MSGSKFDQNCSSGESGCPNLQSPLSPRAAVRQWTWARAVHTAGGSGSRCGQSYWEHGSSGLQVCRVLLVNYICLCQSTRDRSDSLFRQIQETGDDVLHMEMSALLESVTVSGQHVLLAAQKLHIQPGLMEHREELITATQNVFLGVVKVKYSSAEMCFYIGRVIKIQNQHWLILNCKIKPFITF